MIKAGKISIYFIILLVFGIYYSCERIEPENKEGLGDLLQTVMNEDAKWLDASKYEYLGIIEQRHIFEIIGSPEIPSEGDLVFYHDSENHISGFIEEMSQEGSILRLSLSRAPVNEFFTYLALDFNLEDLDLNYYNYYPGTSFSGDTVIFGKLEFVWQNGGENSGILTLDSLRYLSQMSGNHKYFLSPSWEGEKSTRKIKMSYYTDHHYNAKVKMVSKGEIDVADSVLIRQGIAGPYLFDRYSVYFRLEEKLIVAFNVSGNNNFEFDFSSEGRSGIESVYLRDKGWSMDYYPELLEESAGQFLWNISAVFDASIVFRSTMTPVFCGSAGLNLLLDNTIKLDAGIDWPEWDYVLMSVKDAQIASDTSLFSDLPDEILGIPHKQDTLLSGYGQLENNAPVPGFTIEPASGFTDTNFSFDASSSYDQEDDPEELQVRWDFNGDEVWDTNYSYSKQENNIFPTPGNYTVILEVMDSGGLTAMLGKSVFVQAVTSAPTAFFSVTPESGRTTDLFTFDASGCWDAEDDVSLLKVRWDFDGDDIWDTQFSTVKAAFHFFRTAGTYVTKLEVKDTQGLTGSTSRIIEVEEANVKPDAFFTVTPEEGTINTSFLFDASGSSDPEDDVSLLRVRWDFENDGIWDTEYRTIKTVNHIFDVADTYTVIMEVIDTDDFSNTFSRSVLVNNPNTPPRADFTITPATGDTTTLFTFDARISTDLEDSLEELQFRWDWDNNDIYDTGFSFNPIVQKTFDEAGTFIIKLQVKDSGGLTHTKARLVIVE